MSTMPTPNWSGVRVSGRFVSIDGLPLAGSLVFAARVTQTKDLAAQVTVIGAPIRVNLDDSGAFTIVLPATDDPDLNPTDFTYRVTEHFSNGLAYDIALPLAAPDVDIIDLAPVQVANGQAIVRGERGNTGPQGPPGPPGAPGADGGSDAATAGWITTEGSETQAALSATIGAALDGFDAGSRVQHLDAPAAFFGGVGNGWVTGQSTTPTTTTSPVTTGSTVLPVASATGILVDVMLVLNRATADQQIVRVTAVVGTNVTIDKATTAPLASGAAVEPLWVNNAHLTDEGYTAMAYWVAHHPALANVGGSKVTFFGNSWLDSRPMWAAQMVAKFPAATVVNKGKSFDTSALMLARFDADVPADSDYVIFNEPATNDMFYNPSTKSMLNNLVELIRKIEAIGAIPVYLGSVPHSANPALAAQRAAIMDRDPGTYPGVAGSLVANSQMGMTGIAATNHASGDMAMSKQPTGQGNSALGYQAMQALTTGSSNTGVGKGTMIALTTGSSNTGVGQGVLGAAQTTNENTAVGFSAGAVSTGTLNTLIGSTAGSALTTGSGNLMLGRSAGSSLGKQTTTASNQTLVGTGAGQSAATQVNGIVAVGHLATAGAIDAVAIGRSAVADHARSVALGPATTTTAADQVMAGGRDVEITDATKGVILRSPDGTRYRITVANGGALSAVAV